MFDFFSSGYCFLIFQDELSVQNLIEMCLVDDDKLYWCVSSPTMKDKPVSCFTNQTVSESVEKSGSSKGANC